MQTEKICAREIKVIQRMRHEKSYDSCVGRNDFIHIHIYFPGKSTYLSYRPWISLSVSCVFFWISSAISDGTRGGSLSASAGAPPQQDPIRAICGGDPLVFHAGYGRARADAPSSRPSNSK